MSIAFTSHFLGVALKGKQMRISHMPLVLILGICALAPARASRIIDAGAAVVTGGAIVAGGIVGVGVGGTAGSVVPLAGTVAGAAIGGTAGAAAAGTVSGAAEYATVWICSWFDPPDTVNFATRANPGLLLAPFTPSPTWSPQLNAAAANLMFSLSELVQDIKGSEETADRLAGALLVGTPADVADQRQWAAQYRVQAAQTANLVASDMSTYGAFLAAEFPDFSDIAFSTTSLETIRDFEAAGNLDYYGQQAVNAWQLTPSQLSQFSQGMAGISDATLQNLGPMTYGRAISSTGVACKECAAHAPEPGSIALVSPLLLALSFLAYRRRAARSIALRPAMGPLFESPKNS
jgi:hypothetical protein